MSDGPLLRGEHVQCTISPEARKAKREWMLTMWREEPDYQAMAFLRANAERLDCPDGATPLTPSTSPRLSKQTWEKDFRSYKTVTRRWAEFVYSHDLYPKHCDRKELGKLRNLIDELITATTEPAQDARASATCK